MHEAAPACVDGDLLAVDQDEGAMQAPRTPKRSQELHAVGEDRVSPPKAPRQQQDDPDNYEPANRVIMSFLKSMQDRQDVALRFVT